MLNKKGEVSVKGFNEHYLLKQLLLENIASCYPHLPWQVEPGNGPKHFQRPNTHVGHASLNIVQAAHQTNVQGALAERFTKEYGTEADNATT